VGVGGGEEVDEEEGSDEDFILPPRALPSIKDSAQPQQQPPPPSFVIPSPSDSVEPAKKASLGKPEISAYPSSNPGEPSSASSLSYSSQTYEGDDDDNAPPNPIQQSSPPTPSVSSDKNDCPLNCNKGTCSEELVDENSSPEDKLNVGYRCLCPMGTKGTFCETREWLDTFCMQ